MLLRVRALGPGGPPRHRSDWKAASSFFDWASVQEGYSHGSRAYNEMLDILGRMKQIKLMRQLFDGIPHEPSAPIVNEKTFAVLVNRYAAAHKVADAIKVFYKRREYGLDLDLSAFQKLLTALCRSGRSSPVIRSRNIILNGWCVLGSLREAKRFWNDIVTSDCKPDLYTYGIFINSLAKAGKLGTAVKLFTAMWARGCSPDVAICNCIIDALCFKKRIPEALEVFREMDGRGCLPDAATYNTLLKHLCGIGRTWRRPARSSAAMVSRMRSAGCEPDADTYNLLLNLYVRWGDRRGVASIWSEMEDRGLGPRPAFLHRRHPRAPRAGQTRRGPAGLRRNEVRG
ncbi:unnamed protein product [Spirodela intermedia]|uniref:Uncharacterized protein n=1 Tax=Spirodela intermedia TaxID=51605 RepID=A0A7I8JHW3_SPIIN|nr:unnamed protein product [Spirodela intermedia]CAA6669511.1 unnamed protein product [Spirodela intermedia]